MKFRTTLSTQTPPKFIIQPKSTRTEIFRKAVQPLLDIMSNILSGYLKNPNILNEYYLCQCANYLKTIHPMLY